MRLLAKGPHTSNSISDSLDSGHPYEGGQGKGWRHYILHYATGPLGDGCSGRTIWWNFVILVFVICQYKKNRHRR